MVSQDAKIQKSHTVGQWFLNPFKFIAGLNALLIGLVSMVITALIAYKSQAHFDGLFDVHAAGQAPFRIYFSEGFIAAACASVTLFIAGRILSKSSFRIIDILGTICMARWPHIFTAAVMLLSARKEAGQELSYTSFGYLITVVNTDAILNALTVIIAILVNVWVIILMFNAYSISCNLKGGKAFYSFAAAIIVGEILAKAILSFQG